MLRWREDARPALRNRLVSVRYLTRQAESSEPYASMPWMDATLYHLDSPETVLPFRNGDCGWAFDRPLRFQLFHVDTCARLFCFGP